MKNYKLKWKKIIGSFINVALLVFLFEMFFMLINEITGKLQWLMPFIGYTTDSKCYMLLNAIHKMKYGIPVLWLIFALDIIISISTFIYYIKQNSGRKLLIIEHTSLQNMSFSYDDQEMAEYAIEKFPINHYATINDNTIPKETKISLLITEIQNCLPTINDYVNRYYQIGYAGIPVGSIPCVFYLGYKLDDANKKLYFHKFRKKDHVLDDDFHLLKAEESVLKLNEKETENNADEEGKLLVIIALTQPIKHEDLNGVLEYNDYILSYDIPGQLNYDIVSTASQTNDYVDQIVGSIATIQKNKNITGIKICIAASSSFIFALGTKFSKTQNIDTVIYQYEKDSYTWGINITKEIPVIN